MKARDEGHMFMLADAICVEVGILQNPTACLWELHTQRWTTPPASFSVAREISGKPERLLGH